METSSVDHVTETMEQDVESRSAQPTIKTDVTEVKVTNDIKQQSQDYNHLVQIKASNVEIMRRISALIEQKQNEVDENNKQEFCNVHPALEDIDDGCARTKSVFMPRAGGKSHIKVSRVINLYGPQTHALSSANVASPGTRQENSSVDGIEERLANMEYHLKLKDFSKTDVYNRLKSLEERILFLEGLSPEYFTAGPPSHKKKKTESKPQPSTGSFEKDMSLSEIDDRIRSLKESLLKKSLAR